MVGLETTPPIQKNKIVIINTIRCRISSLVMALTSLTIAIEWDIHAGWFVLIGLPVDCPSYSSLIFSCHFFSWVG